MLESRRDFLKSMVGASSFLSLAPIVPAFLQRAAMAAEPSAHDGDSVLVVLQLSGGNDGLNTVVPFDDDAYGRNRNTLRLTKKDVIQLDSQFGFHPQLTGFKRLLDEGHLTVVHGVGYPKSNRDHEQAMREWHSGCPGELSCQTGWIGRVVDQEALAGRADVPAAFVGPISQPFALRAEASIMPSIRQLADLVPAGGVQRAFPPKVMAAASERAQSTGENPLFDLVRRGSLAAQTMGQHVESVLAADKSSVDYPPFTLAGQLRMVSQLIQADLGIRIFFVELGGGGIGGFDNHANQRDNHAALLREMSESIAAFLGDLQRQNQLSRVLLMTFSEFGRTVTENGRRGTDHGAAAPVFLAGGAVKGGLFGTHPSLTDLEQDAQKFQIDYRRVYATLLQQWLGYDAPAILGASYEPLALL